jgi:DHA1 family tetracycline resistance protein-like MFS transporter
MDTTGRTVSPLTSSQFHIAGLFISVFLNAAGFTLTDPVMPFLVSRYTGEARVALAVGLVMSAYSLCECFAAPVLGAWSDRYGRRTVLLASLVGAALGYLVVGFGDSLSTLWLGRILGGLTAGGVGTLYAYAADVTAPGERSRMYGLLGAASGLGFMLGPVIGGTTASWSPRAPLFLAAALTLVNAAWVYVAVHAEDVHPRPAASGTVRPLPHALRRALATTFLFYLAGTMLQANVSVFLSDVKQFDPAHIGMVLFAVGVMDVLSQGIATRLLLPGVGEHGLARAGLAVNACGFLMIAAVPFVPSVAFLFAAIAVFTFGDGLFQPAMSGMIANTASDKDRGQVQGANQGRQAVARVLAPLCAAFLYDRYPAAPYVAGAAIIAGAYVLLSARVAPNGK